MVGTEIQALGHVLANDRMELVHGALEAGGSVPEHNHPGMDIFITPVRGELNVTLNREEHHHLLPGTVLNVDGENTIRVDALQASEFFVYLIAHH